MDISEISVGKDRYRKKKENTKGKDRIIAVGTVKAVII